MFENLDELWRFFDFRIIIFTLKELEELLKSKKLLDYTPDEQAVIIKVLKKTRKTIVKHLKEGGAL